MTNQVAEIEEALRSVAAIPVTPFKAGGQVDWPAYERIIRRMVDGGITVITANGNTGEFYALSAHERYRAVEVAAASAGPDVLIVAGIGFDLETATDLGGAAGELGARAVMVHQPVHPFQSAGGWVNYHQAISEALPELGLIPYIRDALVTPAMVARLAAACPNLVGVKYAVPNVLQFANIIHQAPTGRITWLCGLAEMWAPFFWLAGARGFTSGLAGLRPELSLNLLHHLQVGDYGAAMRLWARLKPFEELRARLNSANNVSVVKEGLAHLGYCRRTVRPPITKLAEAERAEVRAILASWDKLL